MANIESFKMVMKKNQWTKRIESFKGLFLLRLVRIDYLLILLQPIFIATLTSRIKINLIKIMSDIL